MIGHYLNDVVVKELEQNKISFAAELHFLSMVHIFGTDFSAVLGTLCLSLFEIAF